MRVTKAASQTTCLHQYIKGGASLGGRIPDHDAVPFPQGHRSSVSDPISGDWINLSTHETIAHWSNDGE